MSGSVRRGRGGEPEHSLVVLLSEHRDDQRLAAGPRGAGHIVEAQLPPIEELIGHIVKRRDPRIGAVLADDVARGAIENWWHLHPVTCVAAVAGAVDRPAALGESSESS